MTQELNSDLSPRSFYLHPGASPWIFSLVPRVWRVSNSNSILKQECKTWRVVVGRWSGHLVWGELGLYCVGLHPSGSPQHISHSLPPRRSIYRFHFIIFYRAKLSEELGDCCSRRHLLGESPPSPPPQSPELILKPSTPIWIHSGH